MNKLVHQTVVTTIKAWTKYYQWWNIKKFSNLTLEDIRIPPPIIQAMVTTHSFLRPCWRWINTAALTKSMKTPVYQAAVVIPSLTRSNRCWIFTVLPTPLTNKPVRQAAVVTPSLTRSNRCWILASLTKPTAKTTVCKAAGVTPILSKSTQLSRQRLWLLFKHCSLTKMPWEVNISELQVNVKIMLIRYYSKYLKYKFGFIVP